MIGLIFSILKVVLDLLGGESIDAKLTMVCAYGEENDTDGDGTPDEDRRFLNNEWLETDGDTIGNNFGHRRR